MSAPTIAQVDQVGGAQGPPQAPMILGEKDGGIFTKSFSRTYEHYITNNMDASGYTETQTSGIVTNWQIDEGWHLIPYWNPAVAMTASEVTRIPVYSQAVRVKSLGYSIKHAQMFRTEKQVLGGVTTLSNTFCDNPYAEVFCDDRHEFDYTLQMKSAATTQPPYGVVITYPNNSMKYNEVSSTTEGLLPRVKWAWNQRPTTATPDAYETRLLQQAGEGAWAAFSTLNHGARKKMGVTELQQQSYTWHNKNNGWHPHALPQGSIFGTSVTDSGALMPFIWPNNRAGMLSGAAPALGATQFTRGVNVGNSKYAHWNKIDSISAVEHGINNQPPDHYIKLQRLHDAEGKMDLAAKILVEYTCVLEFQPNTDLFAHPQLTYTAAAGGAFEGNYVNNYVATGRLRDFEPYGIPAFSATQPTSEASKYQIYQPASVGPSDGGAKRTHDGAGEGVQGAKRAHRETGGGGEGTSSDNSD